MSVVVVVVVEVVVVIVAVFGSLESAIMVSCRAALVVVVFERRLMSSVPRDVRRHVLDYTRFL